MAEEGSEIPTHLYYRTHNPKEANKMNDGVHQGADKHHEFLGTGSQKKEGGSRKQSHEQLND